MQGQKTKCRPGRTSFDKDEDELEFFIFSLMSRDHTLHVIGCSIADLLVLDATRANKIFSSIT